MGPYWTNDFEFRIFCSIKLHSWKDLVALWMSCRSVKSCGHRILKSTWASILTKLLLHVKTTLEIKCLLCTAKKLIVKLWNLWDWTLKHLQWALIIQPTGWLDWFTISLIFCVTFVICYCTVVSTENQNCCECMRLWPLRGYSGSEGEDEVPGILMWPLHWTPQPRGL